MLKLVSLFCFAIVHGTSQETESNEACGSQTTNNYYYTKDANPMCGPSIQTQADVLQGRPGKMGSRGFKGDKGDQGEVGVCDHSVVELMRSELANLTTRFSEIVEENREMATEYDRLLSTSNEMVEALTTRLSEVANKSIASAEECKRQLDEVNRKLTVLTDLTTSCPGVTFHLPRRNQITDYVQYTSYVPEMKEVTICAWIETEYYERFNAYFSYATSQFSNTFYSGFQNPTRFEVSVNNQYSNLDHSGFQGIVKVHICNWYSSTNGTVGLSLNGTAIGSKSINTRDIIRGNGSLVVGQEQDIYPAGGLDASQAFSGNVTNFVMWPRVLSSDEILGIATRCDCPRDYTVAMNYDNTNLHGEASYSFNHQCPTL